MLINAAVREACSVQPLAGIARFPRVRLDRPPVAPPRIADLGDVGGHQALRVQSVTTRRRPPRNVCVLFDDQPFDTDARIDDEVRQNLSRWPRSRSSRINASARV